MVIAVPALIENIGAEEGFDITQTKMDPGQSHIERTREFFGALIALFGVVWLFWQVKTRKNLS